MMLQIISSWIDSLLADSTDNELYITGVQLEVGSTATPFEHRSFGEELALCQRYFQKSYNHEDGNNTSNSNGSNAFQIDDGDRRMVSD